MIHSFLFIIIIIIFIFIFFLSAFRFFAQTFGIGILKLQLCAVLAVYSVHRLRALCCNCKYQREIAIFAKTVFNILVTLPL